MKLVSINRNKIGAGHTGKVIESVTSKDGEEVAGRTKKDKEAVGRVGRKNKTLYRRLERSYT